MPGTGTLNQLAAFGSGPTTDKAAVTATSKATWYMVGLADAGFGSTNTYVSTATTPGATSLVVNANTGHVKGEVILIDGGTANAEIAYVTAISGTTFTVQGVDGGGLINAHSSGSTHHVRAGALLIQPQFSGRYLIIACGSLTSNTTGDTVEAQLTYGDATAADAPANAAAATGSLVGNIATVVALTGVLTQPFICLALIGTPGASGTLPINFAALKVGNPYWVDLSVQDVTTAAKTVQAQFVEMFALEI